MRDYVVCGWYTPDYAKWYERLERSLDLYDQPLDFVPVAKAPDGRWETTTMLKAGEILKAMDRNPGKTIVFIDVDCTVQGDLSPLTQLRGDVAFFINPRRKTAGHTKAHIRSGTIVLKPVPAARRFVERWAALSAEPRYGDVDQDSLMLAMDTSGVTFEQLDVRWCCTSRDACADPIIRHDSASKALPKISTTRRRVVSVGVMMIERLTRLIGWCRDALGAMGERDRTVDRHVHGGRPSAYPRRTVSSRGMTRGPGGRLVHARVSHRR